MQLYDTISAVSTASGTGGIGIIRVSGKDAIKIVDKIFKTKSGKKLKDRRSHTIHYGHIVELKTGQTIDEVLVMLMKGPKTFTTEDIVEINCHGGPLPVEKVLLETLAAGARLAEPGEFTKRAFLNGRIDLPQAEAVIDVIEAKTDLSLSQAVGQLEGNLSKKIKAYQTELMKVIAEIEVSIDYPEYDIDGASELSYKEQILLLKNKMEDLLSTADTGQMIREGVKTAIIGKPNVGKSSLLNALLQENKAIVTDIPGTTRDVVEAYLNIDGIPFKLLDTAGIRETEDIVEQIGVGLSKATIEEADLVIMILDRSSKITNEDIEIISRTKGKNIIFVLNKEDLPPIITREIVEEYTGENPVIYLSTKSRKGVQDLQVMMKSFVTQGKADISGTKIANVRHKEALVKAVQSLDKVIETIDLGMPEDLMAIDLHDAYGYLGMIIGETIKEEIISELFTRFCLGK